MQHSPITPDYIITSYGAVIPRVVIGLPAKRRVTLPPAPRVITDLDAVPDAHVIAAMEGK
ncbi:hypothetical protein AN189_17490 [Loktanella sp. 3ANDIMAR09]|uniref:hypothetical protein n=1 Tax=Loktanella sp. 3ANDIMAR09 TaxID=1225657 RepID=UPI0006F23C36|nr:hypothetical protein [Loktanella sp. 3ANDIMAR09]KQI67019.1 hypothetical protein AN189_17490 [Loktanella sp. 3ANDIMAR09]